MAEISSFDQISALYQESSVVQIQEIAVVLTQTISVSVCFCVEMS